MDGRPLKGILVFFNNCNDPAKDEEYNRWYNETHIPDVLGTGAVHSPSRWISEWEHPGQRVKTRYMAVYETDQDPRDALAQIQPHSRRWQEEGRMHPNMADRGFMLLSQAFVAAREGDVSPWTAKALLFMGVNNLTPDREKELDGWYNGVHAADFMKIPGVLAYSRYRNVTAEHAVPQYIGIAEADSEDLDAVAGGIQPQTQLDGHEPPADLIERVFRARCTRIALEELG